MVVAPRYAARLRKSSRSDLAQKQKSKITSIPRTRIRRLTPQQRFYRTMSHVVLGMLEILTEKAKMPLNQPSAERPPMPLPSLLGPTGDGGIGCIKR